jgi:hypothetical protein
MQRAEAAAQLAAAATRNELIECRLLIVDLKLAGVAPPSRYTGPAGSGVGGGVACRHAGTRRLFLVVRLRNDSYAPILNNPQSTEARAC